MKACAAAAQATGIDRLARDLDAAVPARDGGRAAGVRVKRLAPGGAPPVLIAGCGSPAADLFEVKRSGDDRNANLTLLVSDDGSVTCNGGKRHPVPGELLLQARELRAAPVRAGRTAPRPRTRSRFRARLPCAYGGRNDHLLRHLAPVAHGVRAADRVHQGRQRGHLWDHASVDGSERGHHVRPAAVAAARAAGAGLGAPTTTACRALLLARYHRNAEATAALIAAGAPVGPLEAAALGEIALLDGADLSRPQRRRVHAAAPRRVLRRRGAVRAILAAGASPDADAVNHVQGPPDALGVRRSATTRRSPRCWRRARTRTSSSRAATRRCTPRRTTTTRRSRAAAAITARTPRSPTTRASCRATWPPTDEVRALLSS